MLAVRNHGEIVCLELLNVMLPMNDKCFMDNISISHNHISLVCELFLIYYAAAVFKYSLCFILAPYDIPFRFRYNKSTKSNHLYHKTERIVVYDLIAPWVYLYEIEYILIYPNIIYL